MPGSCTVRCLLALAITACAVAMGAGPAAAQPGPPGGMSPGQTAAPESEKPRKRIPYIGPREQIPVKEVLVTGNQTVPEAKIRGMLNTRTTRNYDPEQVQRDVRTLVSSGLFRDVRTYKRQESDGMVITFEVVESPVMHYVRFVGNKKVKDKHLLKETDLKEGDPLNRFSVEEARRRIEELYQMKGYAEAQISILEGTDPGDRGVVFQIHEGSVIRIFRTRFIGATIASPARLRTQIESKPGILWLFGGKANEDEIDQDIDRLTAYYRSLGFFRARVGRQVDINDQRSWMEITYVIDEGPRYRVREVRFDGNRRINSSALATHLELRGGEYFNLPQMQRDLNSLRDLYGSQGYVFADIRAEPRFDEQPGILDVVYGVDEGEQYRVGQIHVNIDGEPAHTRRSVVLNRLSIRPGDVVDIREIRSSERRLTSSQLFLHDPARGVTPKIVVKPPSLDETRIANEPTGRSGDTIRGQSPGSVHRVALRPTVDLQIDLQAAPESQEPLR